MDESTQLSPYPFSDGLISNLDVVLVVLKAHSAECEEKADSAIHHSIYFSIYMVRFKSPPAGFVEQV